LLKSLKFDVLIIDTPPYLTTQLSEILAISDVVIVPTKSSAFDALAIGSTLELIKKAQRQNRSLKASIVYSMVKHNSSLCKEMSEIIEGFGYPVFKTRIVDRVDYVRSILDGGILKTESKKAKDEFISFCQEVIELV
jgi:chromosome partitioning protein